MNMLMASINHAKPKASHLEISLQQLDNAYIKVSGTITFPRESNLT